MNARTGRKGVIAVADVMTPGPVTVQPETRVTDVLQLFERHDFNAFPVVNDDGTLAGMVTKLDVLRVIRPDVAFRIAEPSVVSALPVREIMRSGVVTVKAEETLTAATELMVSTRLRSLPVIRRTGGKTRLVGIVTQGDVMRAFQSQVLDTVAG
jgi:CBS domain-containing protein